MAFLSFPSLVSIPINASACCWVKIRFASCMDGTNSSNKDSFESMSYTQCSKMDLSLSIPRARITINRGTGLRTLGMNTTMFPCVCDGVGACTRTDMVRTGLDGSSDTVRMSAECVYTLPLVSPSTPSKRTLIRLSANFSWQMMSFSLPSIMK